MFDSNDIMIFIAAEVLVLYKCCPICNHKSFVVVLHNKMLGYKVILL